MIIKILATITLLVCILNVHAQNDTARPRFISKEYNYRINRNERLKTYADSINKVAAKDKMPSFLFDNCLEYDITLRRGYHSSESVRWGILKKVTNKRALQIILQSNDERLKTHCTQYVQDKEIKIEYSSMSFYDLLQKRFKSLK